MKTTFTLLATVVLFSTAVFAQPNRSQNRGYGDNREVVRNNYPANDGYGRGTYYFTARERDMQVESINRAYYRKIDDVRGKAFMGRAKKERLIYSLEKQRNAEVRAVFVKFNDRRNSFNRNNGRYNDRDRRDNW